MKLEAAAVENVEATKGKISVTLTVCTSAVASGTTSSKWLGDGRKFLPQAELPGSPKAAPAGAPGPGGRPPPHRHGQMAI